MLFLFLCTMSLVSCSDEEKTTPITLNYENPQILFSNESPWRLTPFIKETTPLYVIGGDGNYTLTNSNKEVVQASFDGKKVSFKPLALTVQYRKEELGIWTKKYIIQGDELTVGDKEKLENEIKKAEIIASFISQKTSFTF